MIVGLSKCSTLSNWTETNLQARMTEMVAAISMVSKGAKKMICWMSPLKWGKRNPKEKIVRMMAAMEERLERNWVAVNKFSFFSEQPPAMATLPEAMKRAATKPKNRSGAPMDTDKNGTRNTPIT